MVRRSPALLVLPLLLATGACSVVGYPAGSGTPAPVGSAPGVRAAPVGADLAPARRSDAGRTYEVFGVEYKVLDSPRGYRERGLASWYGPQFHGRPTASGETFDQNGLSAAHRTLPLHTWVEVRNLDNDRRLVLRVNDRGPFARTDERIIDLSYGAARALGVVGPGTARVEVRALEPDEVASVANR